MSGEAWGKGSGFIAGSSEEHGGRMYGRKGEVLRGSPRANKDRVGVHFLCFFGSVFSLSSFISSFSAAPALQPLCAASGACCQHGACGPVSQDL